MILIITCILCFIAFIAYAVMYVLQFRFSRSIFSRYKNQQYWNPAISHLNKWDLTHLKKKEKFFGSSTIFVFLTDAWHLFQFIFENCAFAALALNMDIKIYYGFLIIRFIYAITFNSFFDYILLKKSS